MYPDAKFIIALEEEAELEILSDLKQIIIKQEFNCYCYEKKKTPLFFLIQGKKLTNNYVIEELIKQDMKLECNHIFLEGFIQNTECQFELITGDII